METRNTERIDMPSFFEAEDLVDKIAGSFLKKIDRKHLVMMTRDGNNFIVSMINNNGRPTNQITLYTPQCIRRSENYLTQ